MCPWRRGYNALTQACTGLRGWPIIGAMMMQRSWLGWTLRGLALVAGFSAFSLSDPHAPLMTSAVAAASSGTDVALAPAAGLALPAAARAVAESQVTPVPQPPPANPLAERMDLALVDPAPPAVAPAPETTPAARHAYEADEGLLVAIQEPARPFSEPQELPQALYQGMQSGQVRELQVRLRHAKALAAYDADGVFGPVTQAAVLTFQRRNGLPRTGVVRQDTWDELLAQSHDPTPAELNNTDIGPWFVSPQQHVWMMELQDRLRQVGAYVGPIHGEFDTPTQLAIGRYRAQLGLPVSEVMDERTWARLLQVTHNPSYADLFDALPEAMDTQELDPRCLAGKVVCISKAQKKLSYVVDGEIRFTRQARFSMPQYESPEGDFRIWYKNRDTISRKFGERVPMPYAFFYDGNVAVHFSDDFARNGYDGGSHGCSQLDDYQAAKWLYEQVAVGDRVVVY